MANLFDLSPEQQKEKIKSIVNEAVKKNNEQIQLLEKEKSSLKNQEEEDKYYMGLSGDPELSIDYLGGSIISLLSDILEGFGEVTKRLKEDLAKNPQRGGALGGEEESAEQKIQKQADNLNQLIGEAQRQIEKLKTDVVSSKSLGPGTMEGEFKKGLGKAKNMGIAAFKTGVKWSEEFINDMIDLSMELSGQGKILETPLDQLSPELNKKLLVIAGVLKELSTNPATREAIREIAEAIGISMIEIMEQIKPELDKVTDEAIAMIDQVAEKSARGTMATGVSVAQAFLAEIPWVGGIIDFFLAIGKGFNSLMEVAKTFSDKGGDLAVKNAKLAKGTEESLKAGIDRIETAVNKAKNTLNEVQEKKEISTTEDIKTNVKEKTPEERDQEANESLSKDSTKVGGSRKSEYTPNKQIKNKIQKAGKRLRKTLKMFNKTLPKMRYSLKQNNKRNAKKSQKNKKKYTRKHIV
jgi:hypothetical protein